MDLNYIQLLGQLYSYWHLERAFQAELNTSSLPHTAFCSLFIELMVQYAGFFATRGR